MSPNQAVPPRLAKMLRWRRSRRLHCLFGLVSVDIGYQIFGGESLGFSLILSFHRLVAFDCPGKYRSGTKLEAIPRCEKARIVSQIGVHCNSCKYHGALTVLTHHPIQGSHLIHSRSKKKHKRGSPLSAFFRRLRSSRATRPPSSGGMTPDKRGYRYSRGMDNKIEERLSKAPIDKGGHKQRVVFPWTRGNVVE